MTAPSLVMVPPNEIRDAWRVIRPHVERTTARASESYLADDVYAALVAGDAFLWTTGDLRGFVVLQLLATPYSRQLHVWMASNGTAARARDFVEQLKGIAAEHGCSEVTFSSIRQGWLRETPEFVARTSYILKVGA